MRRLHVVRVVEAALAARAAGAAAAAAAQVAAAGRVGAGGAAAGAGVLAVPLRWGDRDRGDSGPPPGVTATEEPPAPPARPGRPRQSAGTQGHAAPADPLIPERRSLAFPPFSFFHMVCIWTGRAGDQREERVWLSSGREGAH